MTRSKRFITGLLSSYAAIGVNILYTLASVPLALHYLTKEEFGLWALVTQLSGYLMLLEFGMNGSVARSLSDHKDHMQDGIYGSILRTGGRVFAIQGVIVGLFGLALASFAPPLLGIPPHLQQSFTILMAAQAALSGFRLSLGALGSPLWCHQRLDLSSLTSTVSLVAAFAVLWSGFHLGWHLNSLLASTIAGSLVNISLTYFFCRKLGFYPPREYRGCYDPRLFRELFHFAGGVFVMNLGGQLASASQVIILSRLLGIETAAIWSISTKVFSMAQQFVSRPLDSSVAGLAEMAARQESTGLKNRYRDLVSISAVMAVAAGACIALTNGSFVEIWTSGKIIWNPWNNLLLACALFTSAITSCLTTLPVLSKQFRWWKHVCLLEGVAFVALSIIIVPSMGIPGLLIATLACKISTIGCYGIHYTAGYFGISRFSVFGWIAKPAGVFLLSTCLFVVTIHPKIANLQPLPRLIVGASIFAAIVIPTLWQFGFESNLHQEIKSRSLAIYHKCKSLLADA